MSWKISKSRSVSFSIGEAIDCGRHRPRRVRGSDFSIAAQIVLVAYGFDPVPFPTQSDLSKIAVDDWGAIKVDANQMTSVPGVFAGGDDVRGPSLVVHAVRDGRKAAQGIHNFVTAKNAVAADLRKRNPIPNQNPPPHVGGYVS